MRAPIRSSVNENQEDSDEWLIDAARRSGHQLPRRARPAGTSAWRVLINAGLPDDEILRLASSASGADAADFARTSPALGTFLPHAVALRLRVAPLGVRNGVLGVATYNPRSTYLERELAFASKHRVCLYSASPTAILRAQAAIYGTVYGTNAEVDVAPPMPIPVPSAPPRPPNIARLSLALPAPSEALSQHPNLADRLLSTAITERASEAHLVPAQEGGLLIRLRVDGALNDRFGVSELNAAKVIHSLKARAGLDVDDTLRAQQGRATFNSPLGIVELNIATEPLPNAVEKIVIRLNNPASVLGIAELGLSTSERHRFEDLLRTDHGLILVVGPQGSGKSTTLYAAIESLRQRGRRVVTVEQPIERRLEGIQQTDVHTSSYPTLASAARARLNGETDVVFVSTLADVATAETIITGSGRKRFVLSSLDASDMAAAVQRLYELEHDAVALSAVLKGVVAQRLLRRLCDACAATQPLDELPEQQQQLLSGLPSAKLRKAVGCQRCRGTGYEGRTAVVEVVATTPELRAAIARRADAPALALLARECGISNLWDSGINCVVEGVTTFNELLDHVIPPDDVAAGGVAQQDVDALLAQLLGGPRVVSAPLALASPAVLVAPTVPTVPSVPPTATERAPAPAPLRVLLVDDDVTTRRALARELHSAGISVVEAADGVAALACARRIRPDFIVTEVALPRMDAVGLMEALAGEGAAPAVIVRTWQDDDALLHWLREAGATEIVSRSVTADALAKRLRELHTASD